MKLRKQQPSGLLFSLRVPSFRNVYQESSKGCLFSIQGRLDLNSTAPPHSLQSRVHSEHMLQPAQYPSAQSEQISAQFLQPALAKGHPFLFILWHLPRRKIIRKKYKRAQGRPGRRPGAAGKNRKADDQKSVIFVAFDGNNLAFYRIV